MDSRSRQLSMASFAAAIALALFMGAVADAKSGNRDETRLEGRLSATGPEPLASGKAKFRRRGNRVRFSTEVEDVMNATRIEVVAGGVSVGTIGISNGFADLNISGSSVPALQSGDRVEVFDASTNALILSGTID